MLFIIKSSTLIGIALLMSMATAAGQSGDTIRVLNPYRVRLYLSVGSFLGGPSRVTGGGPQSEFRQRSTQFNDYQLGVWRQFANGWHGRIGVPFQLYRTSFDISVDLRGHNRQPHIGPEVISWYGRWSEWSNFTTLTSTIGLEALVFKQLNASKDWPTSVGFGLSANWGLYTDETGLWFSCPTCFPVQTDSGSNQLARLTYQLNSPLNLFVPVLFQADRRLRTGHRIGLELQANFALYARINGNVELLDFREPETYTIRISGHRLGLKLNYRF